MWQVECAFAYSTIVPFKSIYDIPVPVGIGLSYYFPVAFTREQSRFQTLQADRKRQGGGIDAGKFEA